MMQELIFSIASKDIHIMYFMLNANQQTNDCGPTGALTGYAGSSPPGPIMYWLGSSGGTPWDRLGGALPDRRNTPTLMTTCST